MAKGLRRYTARKIRSKAAESRLIYTRRSGRKDQYMQKKFQLVLDESEREPLVLAKTVVEEISAIMTYPRLKVIQSGQAYSVNKEDWDKCSRFLAMLADAVAIEANPDEAEAPVEAVPAETGDGLDELQKAWSNMGA